MIRLPRIVPILLLLALGGGCAQSPPAIDRATETAAVKAAIEGSIRWCFPDKSRERLHAHLAQDSTFFIFHPDSRSTIVGHEHFTRYSDAIFFDPRFTAISSEIKNLRINLSRGGDVAWFSCLLDDRGEWDGRPIAWIDARWTGVLEKRDGKWLLVQQHFSLPTDAQEPDESTGTGSGGG